VVCANCVLKIGFEMESSISTNTDLQSFSRSIGVDVVVGEVDNLSTS